MNQTFKARYTLDAEDIDALLHSYYRLTSLRRLFLMVVSVARIVLIAISLALFALCAYVGAWSAALIAGVPAVIFWLAPLAAKWIITRKMASQLRAIQGSVDFTADANGVILGSEHSTVQHAWAAIRQYAESVDHILFWLTDSTGFAVPKRGFQSPAEAQAFANFAKEKTAGQKL
ncbi:MAG: YcxB family protein [Alphaproteobacteria bacterium]|nr:YcxB family protein [Alphaproteobacteria bacterium]